MVSAYRSATSEVARLRAELERRNGLIRRLAEVTAEHGGLKRALTEAREVFEHKASEVSRLEGSSVRRAFWSALGQPERLEEERSSAREALDAAAEALADAEAERDRLQSDLSSLAGVDAAYRRAFEARTRELAGASGSDGDAVRDLLAQREQARDRLNAAEGALDVAAELDRPLTEALIILRELQGKRPVLHPAAVRSLRTQLREARELAEAHRELPLVADSDVVAEIGLLLQETPLLLTGNQLALHDALGVVERTLGKLRSSRAALRAERDAARERRSSAQARLEAVVERA